MPTVLILGATSDIGFAIAASYAANGVDVQLAARRPETLHAHAADLQIRYAVTVTLHAFDATHTSVHESFWAGLPVMPETVVCVVGYMNDNERVIADQRDTDLTIATNYSGPVSILNIVAASFRSAGRGTIVGISSVAGLRGRQSNYLYGSAKAGFTAYLSGLRNSLYHHGVHVMTVLPGFVDTRMTEGLDLPKLLTAQPEEVGKAVYQAALRKRDVIYTKWFWRYIMLIISMIPESIFKKRKL